MRHAADGVASQLVVMTVTPQQRSIEEDDVLPPVATTAKRSATLLVIVVRGAADAAQKATEPVVSTNAAVIPSDFTASQLVRGGKTLQASSCVSFCHTALFW
jgi:hypothetical protein